MYDDILKKKLQYTFSGTVCDVFKGGTHHGALGLSLRFSTLCTSYTYHQEKWPAAQCVIPLPIRVLLNNLDRIATYIWNAHVTNPLRIEVFHCTLNCVLCHVWIPRRVHARRSA